MSSTSGDGNSVEEIREQLSEIGKRSLEASAAYIQGKLPSHIILGKNCEGFFSEGVNDEAVRANRARITAVLNIQDKEVIYAISGTRVQVSAENAEEDRQNRRADLYDDFLLARGSLPLKVEAVRAQNQVLINRIKEKAKENGQDPKKALAEYKFKFTGHSLGAALSDCAATDMYFKLKKEGIEPEDMNISSVSFDNPGAKSAVQNMIKLHNRENPEEQVTLGELRDNISYKAFNNSKNFINTMDQQVCQKYRIMKDGVKEPKASSIMLGYLTTILKKVPIVRTFIFLCSLGSISKQIKSHSLTNFVDVIRGKDKEGREVKGNIKHKGVILSVDDVVHDREPIKYDKEVFEKLKNKKNQRVEGIAEQEFVMVDPKNPENKVVVTQSQIKQVLGTESEVAPKEQQKKSFASKFVKKKTQMSLLTAKDVAKGILPGKEKSVARVRESMV